MKEISFKTFLGLIDPRNDPHKLPRLSLNSTLNASSEQTAQEPSHKELSQLINSSV
tara:strand:+ start:115 stop:282 length:168 start_codon:yes stop_codon:yes gene_type:complete